MRWLIAVVGTLVLSLVLVVQYPDVMIKPGPLSEGHRSLDRDCFRCHAWLQGAVTASCLRCHKLDDIGRRTTAGVLLPATGPRKVAFHASLADTECMACHTLHASVRHRKEVIFRHELLAATARERCAACHAGEKPADALHRRVQVGCASCHQPGGWRPASFDHEALTSASNCISCHRTDKPEDGLHRQVSDLCGTCHATRSWRPATFDHARYFRFDSNHPSSCNLCHTDSGSYRTYTCYGCHEHSPARIAAEHREEGIRSFENCVRCHRSGQEAEGEGHGEGREREGGEGEDDD